MRQAQLLGGERRHRDPSVIDRDYGIERHLIRELDDGVRRDLGTVQRQLDHARTNHVVKRVTLLRTDYNVDAKLSGGFEKVGRPVSPGRQQ